jgi:hypothetical protein
MDTPTSIECDPFFVALRHLPPTLLLPPNIAEALLHLPSQTFDVLRARQLSIPQLTIVEGQRGYIASDLVQYIEQDPTRFGTIRIRHTSFQDFLTNGLPDDVWVFGMVLLDFHGRKRPVDLMNCLDLSPEQLWHSHCQQMRLAEYVERMTGYLSCFDEQQDREWLAMNRAREARFHAPPDTASADGNRQKAFRRKPTRDRT